MITLKDWFQIADEKVKKNSNSVGIILSNDGLIHNGTNSSGLRTRAYEQVFNLCHSEPFRHQPVLIVPHFTGFLVAEDVVAAAGHNVCNGNAASLCIVFGYHMLAPGMPLMSIPEDNLYHCEKVIYKQYQPNGGDWALLQLNRKVKDRLPAIVSRDQISLCQSVYMLGHPVGLPLKYSGTEKVLDVQDKSYFSANLNVYPGNSGSPVFNSDTHEVIGMAVRGYDHYFEPKGDCWVSIDHGNLSQGEGAQCTRVSEFIDIAESQGLAHGLAIQDMNKTISQRL